MGTIALDANGIINPILEPFPNKNPLYGFAIQDQYLAMIDENLTLPRWSGSLITELLTALGHLGIRVAKHIGPLCRDSHPKLGRLARFDTLHDKLQVLGMCCILPKPPPEQEVQRVRIVHDCGICRDEMPICSIGGYNSALEAERTDVKGN